MQRRLQRGPVIDHINRSVVEAARAFRPDLVWAEKQEYLWPETIEALKAGGARRCTSRPTPTSRSTGSARG